MRAGGILKTSANKNNMLISLLVAVLVFAIIIWAVSLIPLPAPLNTVVYILLAIIIIVYMLSFIGGGHNVLLR